MLFNSAQFLLFFPVVTLLYFVIPHKARYLWLLAASYFFYMCWNPTYALLLATSTLITYASGLLIARAQSTGMKKLWVALSFTLNLAILFFFKYYVFATNALGAVFARLGIALTIPGFDVLLPVGISFYTFQALSYTMDIYRNEIYPEKNVLRYALFVSFFPQLVAGPIERSKNLLVQLNQKHTFSYERMKSGLLRMMYGYFQKIVIADRAALLVNEVFDHYQMYSGLEIAIGAVVFAVQIYCDFGGYSNIAIGAAEVMGFRLMENFRQPYFAMSVKDFWRRWHISLSTWFRDYLYIPLGGSRKGKLRTYCNTMLVFLASGLWHGASWNYVVWGAMHGVVQIFGDVTKPLREKLTALLHVNTDCFSYRLFRTVWTFIIVDIAWIFFRANGTRAAIDMLRRMFMRFNPWIFTDGSLYTLGLDSKNFWLLVFCTLAMFLVDKYREQGKCVRGTLAKQNLPFRWAFYYIGLLTLIIFGVYGVGFDASQFIYFQF